MNAIFIKRLRKSLPFLTKPLRNVCRALRCIGCVVAVFFFSTPRSE